MLSCADFLAEYGNYLEGDLPAELRRQLEVHLAQCSTCQVIVDSVQKTLKIVTEAGQLDLSETLPEPAVARIMEKIQAKSGDTSSSEAGESA